MRNSMYEVRCKRETPEVYLVLLGSKAFAYYADRIMHIQPIQSFQTNIKISQSYLRLVRQADNNQTTNNGYRRNQRII
jgi:hypothetical protein